MDNDFRFAGVEKARMCEDGDICLASPNADGKMEYQYFSPDSETGRAALADTHVQGLLAKHKATTSLESAAAVR